MATPEALGALFAGVDTESGGPDKIAHQNGRRARPAMLLPTEPARLTVVARMTVAIGRGDLPSLTCGG